MPKNFLTNVLKAFYYLENSGIDKFYKELTEKEKDIYNKEMMSMTVYSELAIILCYLLSSNTNLNELKELVKDMLI